MTKDYAKSRSDDMRRTSGVPGWFWLLAGLAAGVLMVSALWFQEKKGQVTAQAEATPETETEVAANTSAATSDMPRFDFYTLLPNNTVELPAEELIVDDGDQKLLAEAEKLARAEKEARRARGEAEPPIPRLQPKEHSASNASEESLVAQNEADALPATAPPKTAGPTPLTPVEGGPQAVYPTGSYLVQAGSFRGYSEADALKAQLVLMGFGEPRLHSVEIKPGERWFRVMLGPYGSEHEARNLTELLGTQNIRGAIVLRVRS